MFKVIYDEEIECPYGSKNVARLPLRLPLFRLNRNQWDSHLQKGDRRQGVLLYDLQCPTCKACQQLRLNVKKFIPNKTQRRIFKKGQENFQIKIEISLVSSEEKLKLYNRHRVERNLGKEEEKIKYQKFLEYTCCETFEINYFFGSNLIGVATVDRAENALSAMYFYFDPDYGKLSPGVFNILTQIELCKNWNLQYLYLGTYNKENSNVNYKAQYLPHERLIDNKWVSFETNKP